MAGFRIDIGDICENPVRTIGIYTQHIEPDTDHYGAKPNWKRWGYRQAWLIDTVATDYNFTSGISTKPSYTLYVGAKSNGENRDNEQCPLPQPCGIQIFEHIEQIRPALSVDNYYDFDGTYAYSVVML